MPISVSQLLAKASEAVKGGDLESAKRALKQALEFDPDNLEVLHQAARFYNAIVRDSEEAKRLAQRARQVAVKITSEMDAILGEVTRSKPQKKPARRHIGGIIGPY